MSFKDMVAADLSAVFLNLEEFGETRYLDGTDCICVVSNDKTNERNAYTRAGRMTPDGLHGDFITICVEKESLGRVPKQNSNFKFDGKLYKVDTCVEDMGMLTITLGAFRQGVL